MKPIFEQGQKIYSLQYIKSDAIAPIEYIIAEIELHPSMNYIQYKCQKIKNGHCDGWEFIYEKYLIDNLNKIFFDDINLAIKALIKMHEKCIKDAERKYNMQVEKHNKKIATLKQ